MAKRENNVAGDFVTTPKELIKAARTFQGWNFYVAPNPTLKKHGTRHTARDVTHWSWLLLDIDPQEKPYHARMTLNAALDELTDITQHDLHPLVLDSGRGEQAWIRLADMCCDSVCGTCDRDYRSAIQITMRYWLRKISERIGLVHGCILDTTTSDLPRIMRCPGTINLKTGYPARLLSDGRKHDNLASLLISLVPEEEFKLAVGSTLTLGGSRWQFAFPHLTETAKSFILHGTQEPGRHRDMWHAAKKLTELELEESEIRKAIQYGNSSCRNGLGSISPLPESAVQHAIDTAHRR